jgi:prepilin-type N-terminal cleavage/methylation domain-containing protein
MYKEKRKAFTLIELMIVIAVVAVLATFILITLGGAREAGEDSKRKGAISQIRSFSSIYYSIQGGYEGMKDAEELTEIINKYDVDVGENKILRIITEGNEYCAEIELIKGTYSCTDGSYIIVDEYTERRCESGSPNCDVL